jgi:AraC-like DNA-binding protein
MDPLSSVLSLVRLKAYVSGGLDAGGQWAVGFGATNGVKFQAIVSGQCWLVVQDAGDPIFLRAGDCVLLTQGRPFHFATDLALSPIDGRTLLSPVRDGGIVTLNGGGDFLSLGGYFTLADDHAALLLDTLPPVIRATGQADHAIVRWCIDRLRDEMRNGRPGGDLVAQQIATMLLVQLIRSHLDNAPASAANWLIALGDRGLGAAIGAIHREPARRWTVGELASEAAMSRTVFATRFREAVGLAPMDYVTRWRMTLAAERLASSGLTVSAAAQFVGYDSEKSFGAAFRRVRGVSPGAYARQSQDRSVDRNRGQRPTPVLT